MVSSPKAPKFSISFHIDIHHFYFIFFVLIDITPFTLILKPFSKSPSNLYLQAMSCSLRQPRRGCVREDGEFEPGEFFGQAWCYVLEVFPEKHREKNMRKYGTFPSNGGFRAGKNNIGRYGKLPKNGGLNGKSLCNL